MVKTSEKGESLVWKDKIYHCMPGRPRLDHESKGRTFIVLLKYNPQLKPCKIKRGSIVLTIAYTANATGDTVALNYAQYPQ